MAFLHLVFGRAVSGHASTVGHAKGWALYGLGRSMDQAHVGLGHLLGHASQCLSYKIFVCDIILQDFKKLDVVLPHFIF